jgi:DNA-binding NarL/FixJ family response regulator
MKCWQPRARGRQVKNKLRVALLDDHQGILDGYRYRLTRDPEIEVVATLYFGEELEDALARTQVDVLLLDLQVPTNPDNRNPFPILHLIPKLLSEYPRLSILIISMHAQPALIHSAMEAGASGYILKEDQELIRELPAIIHCVGQGEIRMSHQAYQQLLRRHTNELKQPLTNRQLEALSLCAAYPDEIADDLALRMQIASSTFRNLLSNAYLKLNVRSRAAAVEKARRLGLLPPSIPET